MSQKRIRISRRIVLLISVLCLLFITYLYTPLKAVLVLGDSMKPTYQNFRLVTVDRRIHELKSDDVAVFVEPSGEFIIKRVKGVAGEHVWEQLISQEDLDWRFIATKDKQQLETIQMENSMVDFHFREITIPPGYVYICGDNISQSICGLRKISCIYGKVVE